MGLLYLFTLQQGLQIFQKSNSCLHILGVWRETWSESRTDDPQLRNDMWTQPLYGVFCLVHVNLYMFLYVQEKQFAMIMLKMLSATEQNLLARNWCTHAVEKHFQK